MSSVPVLGDISAQQFLAEYWQKKPLVIRKAISNTASLASAENLIEMGHTLTYFLIWLSKLPGPESPVPFASELCLDAAQEADPQDFFH